MDTESRRSDPPAPTAPPDSSGSGRRTRAVIVLTSVLALLVMAGVIALALEARSNDASLTGGGGRWADPYRQVPWDIEGCEPDREHPAHLKLDLPPEGVNFSSVKQGVVLDRKVAFRNDGTGTLCIRDVSVSCGCIKGHLVGDDRTFEPGESGTIEVELDTEGREGNVKKTVSVFTNEPDRPRVTFSVQASITVGLIATPLHLSFPRVLVGEPSTGTVRLRSAIGDQDWKVTGVEGRVLVDGKPVPYTYEVVPMKDPNQRILDVRITHPGRDVEGPFQDAIVVKTTHPDRPEVVVRAHLMVVPPISAYPAQVALGYVPAPARKIRVRLLPGTDDITFEVKDVHFEPAEGAEARRGPLGFEATWDRDTDGRWAVDVVYDGVPRKPGPLAATMIVETDRPDMPRIAIDVSATVVEK